MTGNGIGLPMDELCGGGIFMNVNFEEGWDAGENPPICLATNKVHLWLSSEGIKQGRLKDHKWANYSDLAALQIMSKRTSIPALDFHKNLESFVCVCVCVGGVAGVKGQLAVVFSNRGCFLWLDTAAGGDWVWLWLKA